MSTSICPTCRDEIDPAHAPVARVKGARVLAFCSAECADLHGSAEATAEAEPTAAPEEAEETAPRPPAAASASPLGEGITVRRLSRRRTVIAVSAAIVAGGMALAIIDGVSPTRSSDVAASSASAEVDESGAATTSQTPERGGPADDPAPAPTISPDELSRQAIAELRALRRSPSRRVVRLATMALARTGDAEALAGLESLVATEESALNRIAMGYALARAGGPAGTRILLDGLGHSRRDVRGDAAKSLVRLGDSSGLKTLRSMLSIRGHQIGAAGYLARAGDEKAIATLVKIFRDRGQDPEAVMRAAVALGRAGDPSVADFLRSTLADGRYRVGAADALATLGDASAISPLTDQLGLNAMRVRAAVALRRLDAAVPLEPLGVALTRDDEFTRVTAAEAILVLTGPREMVERD